MQAIPYVIIPVFGNTTFNRGAITGVSVKYEAVLHDCPMLAGLQELRSLLIDRCICRFTFASIKLTGFLENHLIFQAARVTFQCNALYSADNRYKRNATQFPSLNTFPMFC